MKQQLTDQQVEDVVCRILANETRMIHELSDVEIEGYLIDAGLADTDENVRAIRKA